MHIKNIYDFGDIFDFLYFLAAILDFEFLAGKGENIACLLAFLDSAYVKI